MRRINYRSDFRFVLSLRNGNVDLSQSPYWKAVLTTTGTNSYEVSRNGDVFKNCEIDELGKLQVVVENHKLEVGELSIEVTLFIPSTDYSDGIELEPVREKTGIMLVPDGGDAPSELDVQVLLPYVYIDAYEIAKRYGYEGTAEDYIDILKNLGLYAKKTEVYEVAGKVDKIGDTVDTLEGEVSAVSGEVGMLSTRLNALNKSVGDLVESDVTINAKVNALTGVVEGKQDKISDLDAIRSGASKGKTALQPDGACDGLKIMGQLPEPSVMVYGGDGWESQRLQGNGAMLTQGLVDMDYTLDGVMNEVGGLLESNTRLSDKVSALDTLPDAVSELGTKVDGKQDNISDLDAIRSGASKGKTALQPDGACDGLKIMGQLPEPSVMVYGGDGWESQRLQGMGSSLTQGLVDMDYTIDGIINELDNKQGVLESGVNIKTINGESILGAGDIKVQGGGGATSSEYFKTFATEADYLAVKDNLETDCIIYIEDKDNIIYHGVLKANFIYEVNEDYEDFCLTTLGVPANSLVNAMLGLAENSVLLTVASPLFSSFIVDGQEMITGDEYFDFENSSEAEIFKNAIIIMPYELGKTYEVQAVFKSTDEIMNLLPDASYATELLQNLFGLSPLTKLTIDDNYVFTMSLTDENTIIGHVFSLMGACMLKELTYNVESNPYINLPENYVEYLLMGFRMGVIESGGLQPYYKERILNVNNDSSWGEPYVSGEFDNSRFNDFLYMMSIPGELMEFPEMINYTINRI